MEDNIGRPQPHGGFAGASEAWTQDREALAQELGTDPERGLRPEQVEENRAAYGSNALSERGPTSLWRLLWKSIKSPMMVLLLSIAAISTALGQYREALVMVFVVAMYVGVHLLNEARSDRTMARLREMQTPEVSVLRDGQPQEFPIGDLVVGDVLLLEPGSQVSADARLLSAAGLLVNEAPLTGESSPVTKRADADVAPDAPLAERPTMVHAGTTVVDGQGRALVVAVGDGTELGRVAALATENGERRTPLQQEMAGLARTLAFVAIGVSLIIPLIGLLRGQDLQEMILTWLSLTFLMVPGQPPIIIAMALALASLELARRQVIVRHLHGAETLGAVTTLLSDKTGTMTQNQMVLDALLPGDAEPVDPAGGDDSERLRALLTHVARAIPEHTSDPTDRALVQAVDEQGLGEEVPWGTLSDQIGFSRGGDYRALEYGRDGDHRTYLAGRPDFIIERSTHALGREGTAAWSASSRDALADEIARRAAQGNRMTAYALREGPLDEDPHDLTFIAAAVIGDPIRPEVADAVEQLAQAGVRVVMVTGDVPATAAAIAAQAGLSAERVVTGRDLQGYSDQDLEEELARTQVFARTTPEDKLRLVEAARRAGQVVAVTGDGVNDAPALHTADIGIAMGERGTDVAREAADLVLTDDNLAHVPGGVAVGRKAYDNFRKGITYYLSAKAILLSIFVVPLILGVPFPLAPIQIIFTELLMDLASSTIFVTEAEEPGIMKRRPRTLGPFLSAGVVRQILRNMAGLSLAILAIYLGSLAMGHDLAEARTAAYATWLLGHVVLALNLKQTRLPLLKQGLLSNRFAVGWLAGMVALVLAMTMVPAVQGVMETTRLSSLQWALVLAGAVVASSWIEVQKWVAGPPD